MKTWQKLHNNPKNFARFFIREQILASCRQYFVSEDYHEAEVPLLAPALPAESYLEVFETQLLDRKRRSKRAFLTTSPEMWLKKLLVAGIGNCFSITKSFRNTENLSNVHNPEFTLLEWYHLDSDYKDLMEETEKLVCFIFSKLFPERLSRAIIPSVVEGKSRESRGKTHKKVSLRFHSDDKDCALNYQNQTIDLTPPWERLTTVEAFTRFAQMDLTKALELVAIRKIAQARGYAFTPQTTWEELFNQIYLNEVVPHFSKNRPVIIYDYPVQLAALAAKPKASDPRFAERFEVYIGGIELADGCTELTDAEEQQKRFQKELKLRQRFGKNDYTVDHELIEALKLGLPTCAGLAMGIDRLVMLFTDVARIQDVLFFPASEMWRS